MRNKTYFSLLFGILLLHIKSIKILNALEDYRKKGCLSICPHEIYNPVK